MNYLSEQNPEDFQGKRVLVRLDLNVPIDDEGKVLDTDADRIKKSLPTLEFLKNAGAKTIVISHIGRDAHETLRPVVQKMEEFITVGFVPHLIHEETKAMIEGMGNGTMLILENLRSDSREEANDETLARDLASFADIFVNDAFAVSHRAHASIVGIPKLLPSFAGLQLEQEIKNLSESFTPPSPSILLLGGAKFETKLPVIAKFLNVVDHIIIGGALANNFYQAMGYEIGASLVDSDANIKNLVGNPKILIPKWVVVENESGRAEKQIDFVERADKIVDIAPTSFREYENLITSARFILWNGPLGNYENGFTGGSEAMAKMIAESSAKSIVGGGDSIALLEQLGIAEKFGFLSTGGGAMLEYLANGTLVGIDVLE